MSSKQSTQQNFKNQVNNNCQVTLLHAGVLFQVFCEIRVVLLAPHYLMKVYHEISHHKLSKSQNGMWTYHSHYSYA